MEAAGWMWETGGMVVRMVAERDRERWGAMRRALWPGHEDHVGDIGRYFSSRPEDAAVWVAESAELGLCGMVEVSMVGGMGYVEGWWVAPEARRQGVGRALLEAGEAWVRGRGGVGMESDCAEGNEVGRNAHRACGYEEPTPGGRWRKWW